MPLRDVRHARVVRPELESLSLQDPFDGRKTALTVQLKDRALSVAGTSEKSFVAGGLTFSHIMDPRTGRPVQGVLTVAVLSDSGTAGDNPQGKQTVTARAANKIGQGQTTELIANPAGYHNNVIHGITLDVA